MLTSWGAFSREKSPSGSRMLGLNHPAAAGERRPRTRRSSHWGALISEQTCLKSDNSGPDAGSETRKRAFNCHNRAQNPVSNSMRIARYIQRPTDTTLTNRGVNARLNVHDQCASEICGRAALSEANETGKTRKTSNPTQDATIPTNRTPHRQNRN